MHTPTTSLPRLALKWKSEPDGLGLYYGIAIAGDAVVRIDLLPPAFEHLRPEAHRFTQPDPELWISYVEGVEIARTATRAAAEIALIKHIKIRVEG